MRRRLIDDNVIIDKTEITSEDNFKQLIQLYKLSIASENSTRYILEGYANDLNDFAEFWANATLA